MGFFKGQEEILAASAHYYFAVIWGFGCFIWRFGDWAVCLYFVLMKKCVNEEMSECVNEEMSECVNV